MTAEAQIKQAEETIRRARKLRARALVTLRLSSGMTRKQLARAAGVSLNTLSAWEQGKRAPRPANLVRLTGALGLPVDAVEKAEAFVQAPMGKDGTEPAAPELTRAEAVRLSHAIGTAFSHVALAIFEAKAGGWPHE